MVIREATAADWPAIWPILHEVGTAGETLTWDPDRTEILATVPEAFHHPMFGYVGLHIMHRKL